MAIRRVILSLALVLVLSTGLVAAAQGVSEFSLSQTPEKFQAFAADEQGTAQEQDNSGKTEKKAKKCCDKEEQ